jgi:hypothetical protein
MMKAMSLAQITKFEIHFLTTPEEIGEAVITIIAVEEMEDGMAKGTAMGVKILIQISKFLALVV